MIKRLHSILFFVKDLDKTAEFYEKLGFDVEKSDDAVRIKFGDFRFAFMDESKVQISKESGKQPKGIGTFTYVEVEDVDEFYAELKEKGMETSSEPTSWPWGKREFAIKDPDGYKLVFYLDIK